MGPKRRISPSLKAGSPRSRVRFFAFAALRLGMTAYRFGLGRANAVPCESCLRGAGDSSKARAGAQSSPSARVPEDLPRAAQGGRKRNAWRISRRSRIADPTTIAARPSPLTWSHPDPFEQRRHEGRCRHDRLRPLLCQPLLHKEKRRSVRNDTRPEQIRGSVSVVVTAVRNSAVGLPLYLDRVGGAWLESTYGV